MTITKNGELVEDTHAIFLYNGYPTVVEIGSWEYYQLVAFQTAHLTGPRDDCEDVAKEIKETPVNN